LVIVTLRFFIGGVLVNYILGTVTGHTAPLLLAGIIGLFTAEITLPLSVICLILRVAGFHVPLFHV
jgi:hypothetical protein